MERIIYDERQRYIIPTSDWGFKYLFGSETNKDLLIGLLNRIIDDCQIEDLEYLNRELLLPVGSVRRMSFDVYCKCKDGSRVIVEMQNWAKTSFVDRALVYTSASILENFSFSRTRDYRVQKTYLIAITGEKLFPKVNHAPVRLALCDLDAEKTTVLNNKILQIFIELPKFASSEDELKGNDSFLNKFSVAMKKMASFNERPQKLKDDLIDKMFHAADIVYLNSSNRSEYKKSIMNEFEYEETLKDFREEGVEEGRAEGREEGRAEGRKAGLEEGRAEGREEGREAGRKEGKIEGRLEGILEIAKSLKNSGMAMELISKHTGLTPNEIEKLQ